MKVTYVNHMGDDLSVVNAARVSFNKESSWVGGHFKDDELSLSERDAKLIRYLASHGHWTPFGHATITLHMKLPMFVQRQIDKHQVGFVVNEVSRRYVDDEPEFYDPGPGGWRMRAENVKQGSSDETVNEEYNPAYLYPKMLAAYNEALDVGVAPEMARMLLPMSMYTESWKTGSLYAWANLYNLRIDAHAQKETQEVARQVGEIIEPLFPISWKALTNG